MSPLLGQQIVIENRGGAGGSIATRAVAKAAPDGYTLVLGGTGTLAINPSLYNNVGYDPRKDFEPVGLIGTSALVLVVHPSVPAKDIKELIAYAKANPNTVNYGIAGLGATYMGMEILMRRAGFSMLKVGFNSNGTAQSELLGGRLDVLVDPLVGLAQHINAGKMKVLAMLGENRFEGWEQHPTLSESLPGLAVSPYYGVIVPRATPEPVVAKLEADLARVIGDKATQKRIAALGLVPRFQTAKEFEQRSDADVRTFNDMARKMNIVLQ